MSQQPVRRPAWTLFYQGVNITADVSAMVLEITYEDQEAHASDTIEVKFEDRDRRWQGAWYPTQGDQLELAIGYAGGTLLPCGAFQVDELEFAAPPDTLHLRGLAAAITPNARTLTDAGFEGRTLTQIATTIAGKHGWTVTGAPNTANLAIDRVTQSHETDLQFLHRLARMYNYDFSVRGTQLVFYSRAALESVVPAITLTRADVTSCSFKAKTHQVYKAARVSYLNPATKQLVTATATANPAPPVGDTLDLHERVTTPSLAQARAAGMLAGANASQMTGRIEMPGDPRLMAGMTLMLSGFGNNGGSFMVAKSRHRLAAAHGYTTEIDLRHLPVS